MNNVASTLGDQGQLEEVAEMMKEVREKKRRRRIWSAFWGGKRAEAP